MDFQTTRTRAAWLLASWLLLAQLAGTAGAVEIEEIRVGFDGYFKVGRWTPVRVEVSGAKLNEPVRGRVEVIAPDGDGVPFRVASPEELDLSPGGTAATELFTRFGRHDGLFHVQFRDTDGNLLARRQYRLDKEAADDLPLRPLNSRHALILTLGASLGLETKAATRHQTVGSYVVELSSDEALPTKWYGYESVDVVLITTSRPEVLERLYSGGARFEALSQWVALGGRLVLSVGPSARRMQDRASPFRELIPGQYTGEQVPLRLTRSWEGFAEVDVRLPDEPRLVVPKLAGARGRVAAREGDLPLVIYAPYRFGTVALANADLDQPPFADWEGREAVVEKLLGPLARITTDAAQDEARRVSNRYGLTDVAGQLRSTLDRYEGVQLLNFGVVAGLAVAYLALLFPLEYFFLRRVAGQTLWTWVTFPAIVLVFCAGAYGLAWWSKGGALRVNQVELVDVDLESGLARGTAWLNLFSPATTDYDVALRPVLPGGEPVDRRQVVLGWLGMPGGGLGGMDSPVAQQGRATAYDATPGLERLLHVPVQQWSTKSLVARWSFEDGAESRRYVEARLADDQGDEFARGTIVNRLDVPLADALLAYGPYAYSLGDLPPGQAVAVGPEAETTELESLLTGRQVVYDDERDEFVQVGERYDPSSLDVGQILRQMMFHRAAGGVGYARLFHRFQGYVDLSGHLDLGRAILVARRAEGGSLVRLDNAGQAQPEVNKQVFYRFVLPVRTGDEATGETTQIEQSREQGVGVSRMPAPLQSPSPAPGRTTASLTDSTALNRRAHHQP